MNETASKRPIIAVELDPPADDDAAFFMDGVQEIRDAGADLITIADCPVGRPRADSCCSPLSSNGSTALTRFRI